MVISKLSKNLFYVFIILFVLSFFLPSAIADTGTVPGYFCTFLLILGTIHDYNEIGTGPFLFDLFLNLPNLLVILTFFFHKKFHFYLKFLFLIMVFIFMGYWTIVMLPVLKIGYWVWFLSSTFFMLAALLIKNK